MATNRDMLKEAIAEAKAIKETAIANAKLALEEAFTPQMKSILSAKIQEMAMEGEEAMEESYDEMDEALGTINDPDGPTAHGNVAEEMEEEVDLDELLAEIEAEEMDENITEAKEEEETEEEEEEGEEEEGEPLNLEDMTDEDLKKMIEDVIADMVKGGELEAGEEGEEEDIDMELDMGADNEEDVDLAELLREIESEESSTEILASALRREFPNASINVQNIEDTDDEGMEIVINDDIFIADGAYNKWDAMINDEEKSFKSDAELISYLKNNMLSETTNTFTAELEEAHNTINTLRTELNEINLLNAKLLYTNKIFKSKTLNESQKVKVLSSFDKATTVKEVKLVYETLNEGLKVKTTNIRENLGSASKATVTPAVTTRQPIIESNDAFARMRALAFYNSKH